ncbi:MAG TPA: hypothetical protein PKD64_03110 [Pirellulaceae bacterium]|nr:hypothetical protein [Pirellulaceae bacterium]HMO91159.1 hypothetical protein [Pirellulaceae bacterium]HMP69071.1 hypothetical protein [Pirellulaceae bacterium]
MSSDSLHERGKALEDRFFQERDKLLLEKMREEFENRTAREALSGACGITDEQVLNDLLHNQITAETLTAISIVPLVAVGWADDTLEPKEIDAILRATHDIGIKEGTNTFELVRSWLKNKPDQELLDTWKKYVVALRSKLPESSFEQLKSNVIGRARGVAQSAGGFLGLGSKISSVEKQVLEDLESAFSA